MWINGCKAINSEDFWVMLSLDDWQLYTGSSLQYVHMGKYRLQNPVCVCVCVLYECYGHIALCR